MGFTMRRHWIVVGQATDDSAEHVCRHLKVRADADAVVEGEEERDEDDAGSAHTLRIRHMLVVLNFIVMLASQADGQVAAVGREDNK